MNILIFLLREYNIKQDPVNKTDHLAALKLRLLFVKTDHNIKWQINNWKIYVEKLHKIFHKSLENDKKCTIIFYQNSRRHFLEDKK